MRESSGTASGKAFRGPGFWERVRDRLLGVPRLLDCVQVEVTSRCPGRCTYCPHTTVREEWDSRDMDLDTFARLWPLMRRSGRAHLQGWGEPLLNPAFFDMAALARKAGCAVSTTTCGLLMDGDVAGKLVAGGLDIVAFSLAGTDAASNASRRGVDFDRVCEAVSTLDNARRSSPGRHPTIHFAYLMLASAMEAVRGLPVLMQRLGVHGAVISTLDYIPTPELESEAFAPHETEKLARASAILKETEEEARRLGVGFHWVLPRPDAPGVSCRENIFRCLFVAAGGDLSPCVYVNLPARGPDPKRRVFGNVRDQDPLAIWESDEFRRFRNRLASGRPDLPCVSCVKRFEI
jgi:MoaA/NifB/PqqE/SkfB family radical SAM enzyme